MKVTPEQILKMSLFHNIQVTHDPCNICGGRTDPDGFDFNINENLVCDSCAQRLRPDLFQMKHDVFSYISSQQQKDQVHGTTGELQVMVEKLKSQVAAFKIIGNRIRDIGENDTTGESDYLQQFIADKCKPDVNMEEIKTLFEQLEAIRTNYGLDCGDIPF